MYLCEFRKGDPVRSIFIARKWVSVVPQRKDIVRLGAEMFAVTRRYIGMDDHVVLFLSSRSDIPGDKTWVFPREREYAREDD